MIMTIGRHYTIQANDKPPPKLTYPQFILGINARDYASPFGLSWISRPETAGINPKMRTLTSRRALKERHNPSLSINTIKLQLEVDSN